MKGYIRQHRRTNDRNVFRGALTRELEELGPLIHVLEPWQLAELITTLLSSLDRAEWGGSLNQQLREDADFVHDAHMGDVVVEDATKETADRILGRLIDDYYVIPVTQEDTE